MKLKLTFSLLVVFISACQSSPTRLREQAVNVDQYTVLVDTRSALDYSSFHFSGSVHLHTSDYLLLKPGLNEKRIFDPDLAQTIERLARRGLHPQKKVILISDDKDQTEAKKWQWLLQKLGLEKPVISFFTEQKNRLGGRPPRALPERMPVWTVKEANAIINQAEKCFVVWQESVCQ